jgi:hypothetical protein
MNSYTAIHPGAGLRFSTDDVTLTNAPKAIIEGRLPYLPQERRLLAYLHEMKRAGAINENTLSLAQKAWDGLRGIVAGNLLVPTAGTGPDGQVLYTWDRGEHHFELEVFPDGIGEFFYMNRKTDATWEADYSVDEMIPEGVKNKLRIFGLYDA